MAASFEIRNDPHNFRMEWEADTPVLTLAATRQAAVVLGGVFAAAFVLAYAIDPASPAVALRVGAGAAGIAIVAAGLALFGLLSNRVRRRFVATDKGYVPEIADPRLGWLPVAVLHPSPVRSWAEVGRVRLDAEYGRVLVQTENGAWRAIHCPAGGFVPVARELRRLIDEAKQADPAPVPDAWSRPVPAPRAMGPLSGTAA